MLRIDEVADRGTRASAGGPLHDVLLAVVAVERLLRLSRHERPDQPSEREHALLVRRDPDVELRPRSPRRGSRRQPWSAPAEHPARPAPPLDRLRCASPIAVRLVPCGAVHAHLELGFVDVARGVFLADDRIQRARPTARSIDGGERPRPRGGASPSRAAAHVARSIARVEPASRGGASRAPARGLARSIRALIIGVSVNDTSRLTRIAAAAVNPNW